MKITIDKEEVNKVSEFLKDKIPEHLGRNYKFIAYNSLNYFYLEQMGLNYDYIQKNRKETILFDECIFKGHKIYIERYEHYLKVKPYLEMYIFSQMLGEKSDKKKVSKI